MGYQADPGDNTKQSPKALPQKVYSNAVAPAIATVQKNPWYVLVNNPGTYYFLYNSTASITGETHGEDYVHGITIDDASQGPVRLDINPMAWSGSAALSTGDVTFVYRGSL